jgi:hypothetical protein
MTLYKGMKSYLVSSEGAETDCDECCGIVAATGESVLEHYET